VFGVTMPRGFGVNLSGTMQSGRAYTPEDVEENAIGASYTKNGPFEVLLNLRLSKDFPMGQETLRLFLTGENILDWEVARRVDQSTGKLPEVGVGQYQDPDEFTMNSVILNPSYEGPPMRWRLGLDYDF
jgi:hypothetical protein